MIYRCPAAAAAAREEDKRGRWAAVCTAEYVYYVEGAGTYSVVSQQLTQRTLPNHTSPLT